MACIRCVYWVKDKFLKSCSEIWLTFLISTSLRLGPLLTQHVPTSLYLQHVKLWIDQKKRKACYTPSTTESWRWMKPLTCLNRPTLMWQTSLTSHCFSSAGCCSLRFSVYFFLSLSSGTQADVSESIRYQLRIFWRNQKSIEKCLRAKKWQERLKEEIQTRCWSVLLASSPAVS